MHDHPCCAFMIPKNSLHQEAMFEAVETNLKILSYFMDAGFDANTVDPRRGYGRMNLLTRVLIAGFHVPSHAAAKFLLERGADIDVRNPLTDETPLLFMAGRTGSPRGTRLRDAAAEFLLQQGANMFFTSNQVQKPLVKAAMKGNASIFRIFLEWLDKNSISLDDTKPLIMEAMKTEHREFAKVLSRWYWRRIYPCPS